MANQEKRVLTKEFKMWKPWRRRSKYSLLMDKLNQISNQLSDLEDRLDDLEEKKPDNSELVGLKGALERKNRFIEDLLIKMLDGNFNVKREDSSTANLSPALKDYLKKKADNGARKLP